jgi:hypothetical protein
MTEPEIAAHSASQRMLGAARAPRPSVAARRRAEIAWYTHTTIPRRVGATCHDDRNSEPDLASARRYP